MSLFKKVLMIGGPVDGKWIDVPKSEHSIMIPDPESMKFDLLSFEKDEPPRQIKQIRYYVMPVELFLGLTVSVGMLDTVGSRESQEAILKAILQRDVATELGLFNGR